MFLHNYEVLIEDSNDGVLGIRQADGQVIRYEKDNDGNYHSNTSALEILKNRDRICSGEYWKRKKVI